MVFFGWTLVFSSLIEFADAFLVGNWAGFSLHLLAAILFGITGVFVISKPVISAGTATGISTPCYKRSFRGGIVPGVRHSAEPVQVATLSCAAEADECIARVSLSDYGVDLRTRRECP